MKEYAPKKALTAFILGICAFGCVFNPITPIVSLILSSISLSMLGKLERIKEAPYRVFQNIAKPFSIVTLVVSILEIVATFVILLIYLFMYVVLPLIFLIFASFQG